MTEQATEHVMLTDAELRRVLRHMSPLAPGHALVDLQRDVEQIVRERMAQAWDEIDRRCAHLNPSTPPPGILAIIRAVLGCAPSYRSAEEPAFSCRFCGYTSDEYGDTHTHAEPSYRSGQENDK